MKARKAIFHFSGSGRLTAGYLIFLLFFVSLHVYPSQIPALIPLPRIIEWKQENFRLDNKLCLQFNIGQNDRVIKEIREILASHGVTDITELHTGSKNTAESSVRIILNPLTGKMDPEGYRLWVLPFEVRLESESLAGLYHGIQTLKQLIIKDKNQNYIKGCQITDWPAFKIRGFMQDVGRNYMPVPLLKEQIDVMAAYKFNVFHLHLTDNPGWRLESLKYPQLNEASSMSRWKGKFYSRQDFIELVEYCNERHITLIPELDIPGHCGAFRKAFSLDSMADPRVLPILLELIDELCELVPADKMPYIHLGTDEVSSKNERPAPGLLDALMDRIRKHNREVFVWRPGQQVENDRSSITQLWSSKGSPKAGHRYIDSRLNYLNHLDPLAGIPQLFFDRVCQASHGDSLRLGGILCCWNDNNVSDPYDILRQNPVYPGMLTYSESLWRGMDPDPGEKYLAKFPVPGDPFYTKFKDFEERLTTHRDRYFQDKPFPYVRQSDVVWNLIGPFDNQGDVNKSFPVEEAIKEKYQIDGQEFTWRGPCYGGTIHIRHFFGYPSWLTEKTGTVYAVTKLWSPSKQETGFWIGFHDWSRSGGRRGGPLPRLGQWHKTNPRVWVNGREILPPEWKNPGLAEKSDEVPFADENYYYRDPVKILLNKGWNRILLKIPQDGTSWKWMFTCVPVEVNNGVHEVKGLIFNSLYN